MTHQQFSNLVEASSDVIYRVVFFMTRDENEAQDILQETFIKFWENDKLHKIENPQGYLMTMAKNLTIDKIRKTKIEKSAEFVKDYRLVNEENDEKLDEKKNLYSKIINFVQQLKEKQKQVFLLREMEGLTYQEISDYLEISESQVKVNLHRARTAIKNQFS
ncbi:MAG: RNA polymerase sigma factor [Flavobacteriales bacterium]